MTFFFKWDLSSISAPDPPKDRTPETTFHTNMINCVCGHVAKCFLGCICKVLCKRCDADRLLCAVWSSANARRDFILLLILVCCSSCNSWLMEWYQAECRWHPLRRTLRSSNESSRAAFPSSFEFLNEACFVFVNCIFITAFKSRSCSYQIT